MSGRLLIAGGPILTMDPGMVRASAVVVEKGRISWVLPAVDTLTSPSGDTALPVIPGASPADRVLDLKGACLVPGFIDAHTHLLHWGLAQIRADLGTTKNAGEALEIIAARDRELPAGEVLIAEKWDESRWTDARIPTRDDLDKVAGARPVVLRRVCGHMAILNSAALARVPIDPQVDFTSGVLVEEAVMNLARIFAPAAAELDRALAAGQASYHSMGVTAVHDISSPDHLKAYARAEERGALKLEIVSILTRPNLDMLGEAGLGVGWRRGHVRIWGVKFFADGSIGARTAALVAPYADAPGETGLLLIPREEMESIVRRAEEDGIPIAVHAIGDRAIDTVVQAFESVLGGRASPLGHRIEHLEMPGPDILPRMRRLGLVASMQPNFIAAWGQPGGMYEKRLGAARLQAMNPFRNIVDAGVRLAFGSDAMPAGVLPGIAGAVEAPFDPQRLSSIRALAAATREAALAGGDLDGGWIHHGARADFTILNRAPGANVDVRGLKVLATITAGETVWQSETSPRQSSAAATG